MGDRKSPLTAALGPRVSRPRGPRAAASGCRANGMTLVELLLGLAITGMVGAAVAAMLSAVSYGTQADQDLRRLTVQHKALDARLGDAIRYARMALAFYTAADDAQYLVLWMSDTRADNSPNQSEIRVLRHDPATGILASFVAATPAGGWNAANDTKYQFNADFAADLVPGFIGGTPEVWADGVSALALRFDRVSGDTPTADEVQAAKLISYRATTGAAAAVVIGAATMRNGS